MTLRLTTRIVLLFVLLTTLLLAIVGTLAYRSGSQSLQAATIAGLLGEAIEKEAALDTWIDTRGYILREIAEHADMVEKTATLIDAIPGSPIASSAHTVLLGALDPHLTNSDAVFSELFIVDVHSGKVLVSTHPSEVGKVKFGRPYFEHGKSNLYVQVPYYSADIHAVTMTAALPLRAGDGRVVAVLAGRLDLTRLSQIVQRHSGLRQSEDAFLINDARYPLTQPRFINEQVVLLRKLDSEAAYRCAERNSGVMLALDYRGVPSIVMCRWNTKRGFGLIIKIDEDEALAPVHSFGLTLILISGVVLLIGAGVAFWLARTITQPLRSLQASVRGFSETHSSGRLPEAAGDELDVLAHEFNQMSVRVLQRSTELVNTNQLLQAEIAARKAGEVTRDRLVAILESTSDLVSIADSTGHLLYLNRAARTLLGVGADEDIVNIVIADFLPDPANHPILTEGLPAAIRQGSWSGENVLMNRRGQEIFISQVILAHKTPDGKLDVLSTIMRDITEHKKTQVQLQLFRQLLDRSADGIYVTDPMTGRFLDVNERQCRDLGYTRAEMLTLTVFDISVGFDRRMFDASVAQLREAGQVNFEAIVRRKDGSTYPVEINASHIVIDHEYSLAMVRDISERIQARQELEFKNTLLSTQQEASPDGILVVDAQARILHYNQVFVTLWNLPTALAAAGEDEPVLRHVVGKQADPVAFLERVNFLYANRDQRSQEELKLADGRTVDRYSAPMHATDGRYLGRIWYFRDITERKHSEQKLRLASEALANIAEGVLIADADSKIVFANKAFIETSGYALQEALGHTPAFLHSGRQNAAFYKTMWEQLLATGHWQGEVWDRHKNGSIYPILLSLSSMRDSDGTIHYVSVLRDISKFKRYEAELEQQAHHDALTQLPNRTLFRMRLDAALIRARNGGTRLSLLFLDLDRFKIINDTLGHPVGDELLRNVSARLERCVRDTDTVARFGGDEFAILLDSLDATGIVAKLAQKILDTLAEAFVINGNELFISASIGITTFPDDGGDIQTLFKNADSAMYEAKASGRNAYRFFASSEQGTYALEKLHLSNDLRHAIARQELHLEYQPRFDLKTGKIKGFEALTRWRHPVHGMIPPDQFIPIAEQTGQIEAIGDWVLHEACRQLRAWHDSGLVLQRVAINLSGLQFARADLPRQIAAILKEYAIEPSLLELELTESVVMADAKRSTQALAELKAMGLLIAIDDFGTGYSSLSYLKRFPVTYLKIDQSFVAGVCDNADDAAITRAIIALAKSLGLKLIAEGVETAGQRAFLEREECDEAQGFLFSHSLPAEQAAALCASMLR
ncbi:MAG: EAL domain-containing protein [Gammaproteobacteria bacterium]|nr:EAL domain-containing protein [Gammaproteobacteria bacterium]